MSIHIKAEPGQVAETVLMPGDPQRAQYIADNFMEDYVRFNGIRGMYGYTGESSSGKRFTVHPSGMGQPSLGIYVNELFMFHGVKTIIRVGTFGSFHKKIPCGSIFLPLEAITDSNMNPDIPKACTSVFLYGAAGATAEEFGIKIHTGTVFSSDTFYDLKKYKEGEKQDWELLADQGIIGVEMESHTLFCLADKHCKPGDFKYAMTLLVASDNLVTGEKMSPEERITSVNEMMKIILEII